MKFTIAAFFALSTCTFCTTASRAQSVSGSATAAPVATSMQNLQLQRPLRSLLISAEGREYLRASGHPLAAAAIQAFGEPSGVEVVLAPTRSAAVPQISGISKTVPTASCSMDSGTRFNLEPRVDAVPQNEANSDFLPNRAGPGDDLIVQAANDWRGNLSSGVQWDQSVSGYYVHRAAAADCSVQFEGGLPSFSAAGNTVMGIGNAVVAADPPRDAFFIADARFGTGTTGGIGLFRATASTLLDTGACPNGTHTLTQATACLAATPPVLVFAQSNVSAVSGQPQIAVDERANGAGTGAGDVYLVNPGSSIPLVACSNSLMCGPAVTVSGSAASPGFPFVRVRPDGLVTISFVDTNADGSARVLFVTCTPSGAPAAPVCAAPIVSANVASPLAPNFSILYPLINITLLAFTYPKHAHRAEPGGAFTTFLVYDDCRSPFFYGNPPISVCLDAEVLLTRSSDGGHTWSSPASVDAASGHHFYPAIAADASRGIVHIAYYSAGFDKFNHAVRVARTEIAAGATTPAAPQLATHVSDPIDGTPQGLGVFLTDAFLGAVARGTGTGQSRLYLSFDSTTVPGSYQTHAVPEENNFLQLIQY